MTDAEKFEKYGGSICYCQDKDCHWIFSAKVLFDDPRYPKIMKGDPPMLPCGHRLGHVVMSATVLRERKEVEERIHELEWRIQRLKDIWGVDDEDDD